jgi:hypothetical protein
VHNRVAGDKPDCVDGRAGNAAAGLSSELYRRAIRDRSVSGDNHARDRATGVDGRFTGPFRGANADRYIDADADAKADTETDQEADTYAQPDTDAPEDRHRDLHQHVRHPEPLV